MKRKKKQKLNRNKWILAVACAMTALGAILIFISLMILYDREKHSGTEIRPSSEIEEGAGETQQAAEQVTEGLTIHFIDVGQGDAALIQCNGHNAMIDVGSSSAGKTNVVSYLEEHGVDQLDYLVLSHGHEDHIGAVYDLFWRSDIKVSNMVYDFGNTWDGNVGMVCDSVTEKQLPVLQPKRGDTFFVGDAEFKVLLGREEELAAEETEKQAAGEISEINNQSLAVLVTYKNNTFLFYGDGEKEYEDLLISTYPDLKVTLLKAPHHGGGTSSQEELLDLLCPQYAVVSSASPDQFGFPKKEVVQRLQERNIKAFYTYRSGTVIAVSDGDTIEFELEYEEQTGGESDEGMSQL